MVARILLALASITAVSAFVTVAISPSPGVSVSTDVSVPDGFFRFVEPNADLQKYYDMPGRKAFAASVTMNAWGWGYGYRTRDGAEQRALRECEVRGVKCLIYAVEDEIVWDPDQARVEMVSIVSSQASLGAVWHYYNDAPAHGVAVTMPLDAHSIISDYGARRGVLGNVRGRCARCNPRHAGIDIIGRIGTPVIAAADGTVVSSGFVEIAGNTVRIRHRDRTAGTTIVTSYIHLDQILVETGDRVERGQPIGTIGVTGLGTTSQRPHLHFEVERTNPHLYWLDGPGQIACHSDHRAFATGGVALTYPVACIGTEGDRSAWLGER